MKPVYPQHKNILILGASGFTGKAVVELLNEYNGHNQVYALQHQQAINGSNVHVINGSLESLTYDQLTDCNPDIIIHLARLNAKRFGKYGRAWQAAKGYRANVRLLHNVEQLNKKVKLVYLSGSLMYGPGIHTESDPTNPISFAREYHRAELPFLKHESTSIEIMMIRAPWILGDGSWFKSFYLDVISQVQSVPVYSPPDFNMMLIGLKDCASVLLQLAASKHTGIYNLFCDKAIPYHQMIELIQHHFRLPQHVIQFKRKQDRATYEAFNNEILMRTERDDIACSLQLFYSDANTLIKETLNGLAKNK